MQPSKEWQKITCIGYVLKEKHLASPHLNLQLRKKKTNQPNKDVPDPEDVLEVVDVEDVVVVKVVDKRGAEEAVEEEVSTMDQAIGNLKGTGIRIKEDHLE